MCIRDRCINNTAKQIILKSLDYFDIEFLCTTPKLHNINHSGFRTCLHNNSLSCSYSSECLPSSHLIFLNFISSSSRLSWHVLSIWAYYLESVSYTHLDVYKRQQLSKVILIQTKKCLEWFFLHFNSFFRNVAYWQIKCQHN